MQLKLQPQSIKIVSLLMSVYYFEMKDIIDNLILAHYYVLNYDFVLHLLQGLPTKYDPII